MFKTENIPVHPDYLKYPSSDGQPMAETTLHFQWMVKVKENLDELTQGQNIFVASDLLWYPVQGDPKTCKAPDVMVAIGRPKGDRYSYLQWHEAGIPPQVVFEIFSNSNRRSKNKQGTLEFYLTHGVQEFYSYDPEKNLFTVRLNQGDDWQTFEDLNQWESPSLHIRFEWSEGGGLQIYAPSGKPFKSFLELGAEIADISEKYEQEKQGRIKERKMHLKVEHDNIVRMKAAEAQAAEERMKTEAAERQIAEERRRAEAAERQIAEERMMAERQIIEEKRKAEAISRDRAILMEKLKSMGIDPAELL